jgi:hypothetical protein
MRILFDSQDGKVILNRSVYAIEQGAVDIDLDPGWHLLKFQGRNLRIKDIEIDGMSIGAGVLTMFNDNGSCCWGHIDGAQASWLPINNSYAQYIDRVGGELINGCGQQIYEHFEFVFDQGIDLQGDWPKHIRDYFSQRTGAHWLPKWKETSAWFRSDTVDIDRLSQECSFDRFLVPIRTAIDDCRGWIVRHAEAKTIADLRTSGLCYLADLAQEQGFYDIYSVNLNTLYPGGYIGPHVDGNMESTMKKIYVNLDPSDQVYYRFGNYGLVPMHEHRMLWLDTEHHVHAVVNTSDQARRIVSISGHAHWPAS